MKIGLSVSICIKDIVEGNISIDDVRYIYTSARISDFEAMILNCQRIYWHQYPEEAATVARRLWDSGKIKVPKTEEGYSVRKPSGVNWVASERDIQWEKI